MFTVSDPLFKGKSSEKMETEADDLRSVKLEVEDPLEEECGPLHKRSKQYPQDSPGQWKMNPRAATVSSQNAGQYNPLDEPSPLGLRLRKSPSLLELIQMKISLANAAATSSCITDSEDLETRKKKDRKWNSTGSGTTDKLKASNFPASILRIGTWERVSRYEGDLVAKCYFAKHKLVWEVLDGGLKSKIEIQWSDITALKASCTENKPGTLDIVVARQPLFFKETNPQPRKHTLWQATTDFTCGQASIHKRHFLQCAPGILSKHFEKLVQCDMRLYSLSQKPDIVLESPYFDDRSSVFDDQEEPKGHVFDLINDYGPGFSGFRDIGSTCSPSPTSSRSDARETHCTMLKDSALIDAPSPSSVMDTRSNENNIKSEHKENKDVSSNWDQFKVAGLNSSMSMNDLVSHIGNCISGKIPSTANQKEDEDTLNEITQYLLGDSHTCTASDEKLLMSRVNSLCCLLQKDPVASVQTLQINKDNVGGGNSTDDENKHTIDRKPSLNVNDASLWKQPSLPRIESLGDLLLNLPRIASLPQFLFNISEDAEYKSG